MWNTGEFRGKGTKSPGRLYASYGLPLTIFRWLGIALAGLESGKGLVEYADGDYACVWFPDAEWDGSSGDGVKAGRQ